MDIALFVTKILAFMCVLAGVFAIGNYYASTMIWNLCAVFLWTHIILMEWKYWDTHSLRDWIRKIKE